MPSAALFKLLPLIFKKNKVWYKRIFLKILLSRFVALIIFCTKVYLDMVDTHRPDKDLIVP